MGVLQGSRAIQDLTLSSFPASLLAPPAHTSKVAPFDLLLVLNVLCWL